VLDLLLCPVEEDDDFLSETLLVLGLEISFEPAFLQFEVLDFHIHFVCLTVGLTDVFELSSLLIFEGLISVVLPRSEVSHRVHNALLVILLQDDLVSFVALVLACLLLLSSLAHLRQTVS